MPKISKRKNIINSNERPNINLVYFKRMLISFSVWNSRFFFWRQSMVKLGLYINFHLINTFQAWMFLPIMSAIVNLDREKTTSFSRRKFFFFLCCS